MAFYTWCIKRVFNTRFKFVINGVKCRGFTFYPYVLACALRVKGYAGYATVDVVVNAAPRSGSLTLAPSSGFALSDAFAFRAENWVDDIDDYPFVLSFFLSLLPRSRASFARLGSAVTFRRGGREATILLPSRRAYVVVPHAIP